MNAITLALDTLQSLFYTLRAERYEKFHVRAVYKDNSGVVDSIPVDSATIAPEINVYFGTALEAELSGFAVYGHTPEPMFICGDELRYKAAAGIAWLLNRIY